MDIGVGEGTSDGVGTREGVGTKDGVGAGVTVAILDNRSKTIASIVLGISGVAVSEPLDVPQATAPAETMIARRIQIRCID